MRYLKNQRGSALVLTLILLMIVTILGTAMLFSIASEIKLNRAIEDQIIASYLAEAGIDYGLYLIENKYDTLDFPYEEEIVLGDRSRVYKVAISKSGTDLLIRSTGLIEADGAVIRQMTLDATVLEDGQVIVQE